MKTSSFATLPALLLLLAGAAAADRARAGEVYKCVEGGSTVYQDLPCPGNPDQPPRGRYSSSLEGGAEDAAAAASRPVVAPPVGPSKQQLSNLYTSLHEAEQDRDRVEQGYKAEVEAAQQRNKDNPAAAAAEAKAINQRWTAQAQEVEQRQKDLASQAQQMCPGSKEITRDGTCR